MTRHLAVVIFPGFQLLDAAGPIAAFEIAARFAPGTYDLRVLAPRLAARSRAPSGVGLPPSRSAGRPVRHGDRRRRRRHAGAASSSARSSAGCRRRGARRRVDQRLLRRLPPGRGRPAGRPARHHPLEPHRRLRAALSEGEAGRRPHLHPRRRRLDLGRHHRRHRPGAGAHRGRPRRRGRPRARPSSWSSTSAGPGGQSQFSALVELGGAPAASPR